HAFVVFHADRSVGRGEKLERWGTICRESAMLARRLRVPEVSAASSVEAVIGAVDTAVLLARDSPRRLADMTEPRDVALLIGPEAAGRNASWSWRRKRRPWVRATCGPRPRRWWGWRSR